MKDQQNQFYQLLSPLYHLLRLSGEAYSRYASNKIYLNAQAIRWANRKIVRLLNDEASQVPADLRDDIVILLEHYQGWLKQFQKHKKKTKPSLVDEFIFHRGEKQSPYPKEVEQKIFNRYEEMKKQLGGDPLFA